MSQKQKVLYEARDIAMHVTATIMLLCDNRYAILAQLKAILPCNEMQILRNERDEQRFLCYFTASEANIRCLLQIC